MLWVWRIDAHVMLFLSFSGLMVGCAVQIPEQWVYQTHPAWQAWTGRFALRLFLHRPLQKRAQLLISPDRPRPLQTTAVSLSLKPITTTPTPPTSLVVWKQSCVYFSWLAVQMGGSSSRLTNQNTSTLGGGASAVEVAEWEEFKASGFTAGRVSVSICLYVCIRDIFCIFQAEGIWSDSLLDWITGESETGHSVLLQMVVSTVLAFLSVVSCRCTCL